MNSNSNLMLTSAARGAFAGLVESLSPKQNAKRGARKGS
jgi:hypothetical protein